MNSVQIQCFLTVAAQRNFSKAAELLYLSQPSVSRYIAQLEEEWGVPLFVRSGKNVALTPQGEDYHCLCLRLARSFEDLREKYKGEREQTALSLQYSVFPAWNISKLLYENAAYVQGLHPNWDISLKICQASDLVRELRQGSVDLIFTVGTVLSGEDGLKMETLLELPQMILYSEENQLARRAALTPEDFAGEDFLFVPDEVLTSEMIRRQARSMEKRYGFAMKTRLLTNTDELTLALELNQGVALMDTWSRYRSNPHLRSLRIDLDAPVVLAWREEGAKPALAAFARDTADFFKRQNLCDCTK